MKLSIYLFKDNINSFDGLIKAKYADGKNPYEEIYPIRELGYESKTFIQINKTKSPNWLNFLKSHFNLEVYEILNASNSFIIFVKVNNRIFAATFGYGYSALESSKIQPNFGIKVTLNSIGINNVDTIDTRNIDLVTKQRRTHINTGSSITEFELRQMVDWVRYVGGKPEDKDFAKKVTGADSLGITCDVDLERLGKLCEDLLEKYNSNNYQENFSFIDDLRQVAQKDPLINELNKKLNELLDSRSTNKITVTYPEIPDTSIESYKIYYGSNIEKKVDEITLDDIYIFLNENPDIKHCLNSVSIIGIDGSGNPKTRSYKLKEYMVCEVQNGEDIYILSLNQWFKINRNFVNNIKDRIRQIPDLTHVLNCIPIKYGEPEGDYNIRLANTNNWIVLDKELFSVGSIQNKFEPCDILTADKKFICVKKMTASATLSHLFAQGSVSAKLLRGQPEIEEKIKEKFNLKWNNIDYDTAGNPNYVYAIPTKKAGALSENMFFFSLINLLDHVEVIKSLGYDVSLCKIEYEP